MKSWFIRGCALALGFATLAAEGAVCTTESAGWWSQSGIWSCGHVPFPSDTVVVAHNVTLNQDDTVAGLTINAGARLTAGNNDDLTVTGDVIVNGTYTGGENLYMTGTGATLSGTGTFDRMDVHLRGSNISVSGTLTFDNDARLNVDAFGVRIAADANLTFSGDADIRVGDNRDGSLIIDGRIDATAQPAGNRILRLDNDNTSAVTINGVLDAPNSYLEIQRGGTVTNNGSVNIAYLDGDNTTNVEWTQGAGADLTMTAPAQGWRGTFNASAPGNTVTYNGTATPLTPSNNTYYNLAGTNVRCPVSFIILGASPCGPTVTSITRADANFTDTATVSWTVTFSVGVTGVDASDFVLVPGAGVTGAAITTVAGSGSTWTVSASTGAGAGTLGLNLVDNDSIVGGGVPLGGPGVGNGNFTGEVYTKVFPVVQAITAISANPTEGAASVDWRVVFSTSVVGVDAGDFALVPGGGVTGAAITGVTGGGTTWTVTATTGTGTGTLGLNLLDDDSILDSSGRRLGGAGPGNGDFAGETYAVAMLSCWTDGFDRADGNPGTGWIVSSVSGNFGTPKIVNNRLRLTDASTSVSTMATLQRLFPGAGNKIVIEFEHFAYGGSGADGIGVVLSDSDIDPVPGAFGGSLGYAQKDASSDCPNCPGFAGGWLGVGIDEFGNFSNPTEGRIGGPGQRRDSVAVRGSGAGLNNYRYHRGTTTLTPQVDNNSTANPPYRYRITVDHSNGVNAWVTVERSTDGGTTWPVLIPRYDAKAQTNQAPVPANWILSYTGSTGGSTNIHEIDNLRICATSQVAIGAIDHIRIEHPTGNGVTCAPSTLTIKACADAACASLSTEGVTGTLVASGSATVNWVGGADFAIPAGSGSVEKQVQITTAGSVVLGVESGSVSPEPLSATACNFGLPECTFVSADSGFLFDVPNHVAETPQSFTIRAVKKADDSLACVPAFGSRNGVPVTFRCSYANPSSGTLPVRLGQGNTNTPLAADTATACSVNGATVALDFDANGVAQDVRAVYADVGQVNLSAAYMGDGGTSEAGLTMLGSDSFIAAPARFALTVPAAAVKAGAQFEAWVEARNAADAITPNFGQESLAESVQLTTEVTTPPPGETPNNPALDGSFGSFGVDCAGDPGTAGRACGRFSWSEVGTVSLHPGILPNADHPAGSWNDGNNYLGSGIGVSDTPASMAFIPHHYWVGPATVTHRSHLACVPTSGFTYLGEPLKLAFEVRAHNSAGAVTQNYYGSLATLDLTSNAQLQLGVADGGTPLTGRVAASHAGTWNHGVGSVTSTVTVARGSDAGFADYGPYDATFGIAPVDANGVTLLPAALDFDADTDGTDERQAIATARLYQGRIALRNAYGSELLDLQVPLSVEHYTPNGFVINGADHCTLIPGALSTSDVTNTDDLVPAETCVCDTTGASGLACAPVPAGACLPVPGVPSKDYAEPPNAGSFNLWLARPGVGNTGSIDVTVPVDEWLKFDWDGDGDEEGPSARASFGTYSGSPRHIYLRELY